MLGRKKLFRKRDNPPTKPEQETPTLKEIFRDQDELVGLNVSIADSKEALQKGRGAIGRAILGTTEEQPNDGSAIGLLQAGRQGVLQQIASSAPPQRAIVFDPASAAQLADQLHSELIRLTTNQPADRFSAKSLEIQIQTTLRAYSNSIHRLLTPLTFR